MTTDFFQFEEFDEFDHEAQKREEIDQLSSDEEEIDTEETKAFWESQHQLLQVNFSSFFFLPFLVKLGLMYYEISYGLSINLGSFISSEFGGGEDQERYRGGD